MDKKRMMRFEVEIPEEFVKSWMYIDDRRQFRWYGDDLKFARNWLVGAIADGITKSSSRFLTRLDEIRVTSMELKE